MNVRAVLLGLCAGFPAAAGDQLTLKNGRTADCRILSFSDQSVTIRWREEAPRVVPLREIEFITFAPLPGEEAAVAAALGGGALAPLMEFWVKRMPRLGMPRSNAGELGLVYAELLSRQPTGDRLARSLAVYRQIESGDWSEERRGRARAGRLRLLLRAGQVEAVRPEAEKLMAEQQDPRVLIEVHHVLAEAAAVKLQRLLREHPRWELEEDIRPGRDRLYAEALDGWLYPHVFHGAEEDLAARGLWAAAQFYWQHGAAEAARAAAGDLLRFYPAAAERAAAQAWIEQLPPPAPVP